MDQSAKWLLTGLSNSYRGAEISLSVTSTPRPVRWPSKDNSFLRRSDWSRKLRNTLNAVLRLITDGVLSPCHHTSSGLGRLVLRLLWSTSALILWVRGPHAVGLGVWRSVSWMYCILQLCKAERCSMPPVDAVWGVGVAARPQSIVTIALASEAQSFSDLGGDYTSRYVGPGSDLRPSCSHTDDIQDPFQK